MSKWTVRHKFDDTPSPSPFLFLLTLRHQRAHHRLVSGVVSWGGPGDTYRAAPDLIRAKVTT